MVACCMQHRRVLLNEIICEPSVNLDLRKETQVFGDDGVSTLAAVSVAYSTNVNGPNESPR